MGRPGYVYVMRLWTHTDPEMCPYKIGKTTSPKIRASQLGIKMPFEMSIILLLPTNDMDQLERDLHDAYWTQRLNGEWFHLPRELMSELVARAGGSHEQCVCHYQCSICPHYENHK